MAPVISGCFGAIIFTLIKVIVHMRKNPVPWAVYSSPFWFLVAATICTLSIVYKGSPNLGLGKKPIWYIVAVTLGTGFGVCLLSIIFFVPFLKARILNKDHSVKWWMFILGPLLLNRPVPTTGEAAKVPNYAVVQDDEDYETSTHAGSIDEDDKNPRTSDKEKQLVNSETAQLTYKEIVAQSEERHRQKLLQSRGPLGWAMRFLRDNPMGAGEIYEVRNMVTFFKRLPPMIVCGLLYGFHYDIHTAQSGVVGTPEGERMKRVYAAAEKYPNEVEHTYSFVQVLTACTASFAHGANDIGNSVGPWAAIYSAWSTGKTAGAKAPVPVWQLAVLALWISLGLCTYGYNIMKGKFHVNSPFEVTISNHYEQLWVTRSPITPPAVVPPWRWVLPLPSLYSLNTPSLSLPRCVSPVPPSVSVSATEPSRLLTSSVLVSCCLPGS
jgi:sodium-dependent phosphate transporter